jgi:hypothetical protein
MQLRITSSAKNTTNSWFQRQFRSVLTPLSTPRINFHSLWRPELFCSEMLITIWIASFAARSMKARIYPAWLPRIWESSLFCTGALHKLIKDRNTHTHGRLLLTTYDVTNSPTAVASSDVTDRCILRDINSTISCIAPSHHVKPAPSTILTVSTVYWNCNVSHKQRVKNETYRTVKAQISG